MGRLILHIGTHKTATTTLQHHLARNRKTLAARGIWYPDYSLIGKKPHYAHVGIVNAFSGRHDKFTFEDARHFFKAVAARVTDYEATIISGEPFYRHIEYDEDRRVPWDPDRYWPLRMDYITRVREAFGAARPEIAVVFRRQADYAPSLYQEHVKVTRYLRDFATFRREFWYHFDYLGQARAWAAAFGRLDALRFEDLIAGGDPVGRFGRHLQLDLSGPETVRQQNVSMHPDAVVLKRRLNATKIDKDVLRAQVETLMAGPLRARMRKFANRSLYADAKDLRVFHRGFTRDNETLKREFFPDLATEPAPLFSEELRLDQRFGDDLHPYFLNILVRRLNETGGMAQGPEPAAEPQETGE